MRTFIAIEIRNEIVLNAITKIQSEFKLKATPVSKQNMHFTLFFLGEISQDIVENVKQVLSHLSFQPMQVKFTHIGVFPNSKFPKIIWIGVDEVGSKQLMEVAAQVEKRLAPIGFRPDKPFKPHMTIFRIKTKNDGDIAKILEKYKYVELGQETITEIKLKQSILTSNGPIYSDLQVITAR